MKEEEKLWKNELDALLGKLVDDGLTVADKARLNEILQTEPEAREFYHEYLDLHGALVLEREDGSKVQIRAGEVTIEK